MVFSVKYRDSSGAVCEKAVEAANRADCFAKCKAQGIVPVGVSDGDNVSSASKRSSCNNGSKGGNLSRWVVCTIVLALAGGIVYFLVNGKGKPAKESAPTPEKTRQIASVQPAAAPKPVAVPEKPKVEKKPKKRRVGEIKDGFVLLPSGELYKVNGVITTQVASTSIADKTFKYNAERQIAHLLMVEPGEGMLGDGETLYSDFDKEFKEALKDEITYDDKDTPEQRELKAAMIDIRAELVERMKKGEDLSKVLIETRKQLQELALYKDELRERIEELKKDGNMSKQDRLDLLEAANEMLKERGIQPFLIPSSLQKLVDLREMKNNR
jgi:hypothetical protein